MASISAALRMGEGAATVPPQEAKRVYARRGSAGGSASLAHELNDLLLRILCLGPDWTGRKSICVDKGRQRSMRLADERSSHLSERHLRSSQLASAFLESIKEMVENENV